MILLFLALTLTQSYYSTWCGPACICARAIYDECGPIAEWATPPPTPQFGSYTNPKTPLAVDVICAPVTPTP